MNDTEDFIDDFGADCEFMWVIYNPTADTTSTKHGGCWNTQEEAENYLYMRYGTNSIYKIGKIKGHFFEDTYVDIDVNSGRRLAIDAPLIKL